ncbi:hypothetical protein GCM10009754_85170 [Amycolatopsis minnesotensis]|uniref:Uncharacterized protein n=1 Tax=Amycolatopsis minnesotensis TaxID=337894 RepID=A0ABN2SV07_9PSEU
MHAPKGPLGESGAAKATFGACASPCRVAVPRAVRGEIGASDSLKVPFGEWAGIRSSCPLSRVRTGVPKGAFLGVNAADGVLWACSVPPRMPRRGLGFMGSLQHRL